MAIKIPFIADVVNFLKGTKDMEESLEDVSGALDDLGRNNSTEQLERNLKDVSTAADTAAEGVETNFLDTFTKLKAEGKTAGKAVGKALHDGASEKPLSSDDVFKADLKAELVSNMVEAGAEVARGLKDGFDSEDLTTIVDGVSDTITSIGALGGPLGAAGGLAAASAMNLLVGPAMEEAKKDAETYQRTFTSAFDNIVTAGAEMGRELTIQSSTNELVQDAGRFKEATDAAAASGLNIGVVLRAMAGDADAVAAVQRDVTTTTQEHVAAQEALRTKYQAGKLTMEQYDNQLSDLNTNQAAYEKTLGNVTDEYKTNSKAVDAAAAAAAAKGEADKIATTKTIEAAAATAKQSGAAQDLSVELDGVSTSIRVMPNGKIVKVTDDGTAKLTQEEINEIKGKTVTVSVKPDIPGFNKTLDSYLSGKLYTVNVKPKVTGSVTLHRRPGQNVWDWAAI